MGGNEPTFCREGGKRGGDKRRVYLDVILRMEKSCTYRDTSSNQASISSLGHHGNAPPIAVGKQGGNLLGGARLKDGGTCRGFPFTGPVLGIWCEKVIVVWGGGGEDDLAVPWAGGGGGGVGGGSRWLGSGLYRRG